jgi:SAM-dependent methyltransferase
MYYVRENRLGRESTPTAMADIDKPLKPLEIERGITDLKREALNASARAEIPEQKIALLEQRNLELLSTLESISSSFAWSVVCQFRKYRDNFFPSGSVRRRWYDGCVIRIRGLLSAEKRGRAIARLGPPSTSPGSAEPPPSQSEGYGQTCFPPASIEERSRRSQGFDLPMPPDTFCMRVGGTKGEAFISQGRYLKECLIRCFPIGFSWSGKRVLDFGCGVGRVLRHFAPQTAEAEFWGADIHEPSIRWLAENSAGIFGAVKTESFPSLPFPANHFDLIYSISVFTHVYENWAEWLAEIRRVLVPGGLLVSTFHNRVAYEYLLRKQFHEADVGMEVHSKDAPWDLGGPQVFHSKWWIMENWDKFLPVQYLVTEGLVNWQSVAVMQKNSLIAGSKEIQIFQPFPFAPWNGDFFGNVEYDPLASKTWLVEHGLICEDTAEIRGWFLSASGPVVRIEFALDTQIVHASVVRQERPDLLSQYPSILHSRSLPPGFHATLGLKGIAPGAHQARVTASDGSGRKYTVDFTLFKRNAQS